MGNETDLVVSTSAGVAGRARLREVLASAMAGAVSCALAGVVGVTLMLFASRATAQAADPPATVNMVAQAAAAGTWFVQGESALGSAANQNFISNAAFVVTPAGELVIDALGSPPLAARLLALIRERTSAPLRYVVVTHCHADHIYGLQVFKAAGARIVAHAGCRDYLASDSARLRLQASREEMFPWIDERTELVTPDQWLGDDGSESALVLSLGDRRFRIQHAGPAHTREDLIVHDETTGVVFAGDIVFRGRVPFVGHADSRGWIKALDRLLALQPRVLVPGHGALSLQPAADLTQTRDYLMYLRQTMGEAARRLEPFDEAYARTDWSRFASWPLFMAANRMNAYNTYLLMEHEAP
jgi:glyoxylase-like metal-dependent hydrolase (beta-lactamase superfamily II)